jgi:hypothetical protein
VIIHDFNVFGSCFRPPEAQTKLIVYTNAVLTGPVAFKRFQSIPWRHPSVIQSACDLELSQLASRYRRDVHEPWDAGALRQSMRVRALKGLDHGE